MILWEKDGVCRLDTASRHRFPCWAAHTRAICSEARVRFSWRHRGDVLSLWSSLHCLSPQACRRLARFQVGVTLLSITAEIPDTELAPSERLD